MFFKLLLRKSRSVYALQHFVFRIAAPVSTGHAEQLERLNLPVEASAAPAQSINSPCS